jgi:hypothetical protein
MVEVGFLEKIVPRVSHEMNEKLMAPYTADGVKEAILALTI